LVNYLKITCPKCSFLAHTMTSNVTTNRLNEIDIKLMYAIRSIGEGEESA